MAMLRGSLLYGLIITLSVAVIVTIGAYYKKTTNNERELYFAYFVAKTQMGLLGKDGYVNVIYYRDDGETRQYQAKASSIIEATDELVTTVNRTIVRSFLIGIASAGFLFVVLLYLWARHGKVVAEDEHLRGVDIVEKEELIKLVTNDKLISPITLGGVPTRKGGEMLNFLLSGAVGTGKSVALQEMMDCIRRSNKRAVIYDPTGEFTQIYFREGKDVILNPFDARSPGWNIWQEIREDYDYASIASGLFPDSPKVDPFFNQAARVLFEDLAKRLYELGEGTNQDLIDSITKVTLEELYVKLTGTGAATLVDPSAEKTGAGIRMTALNGINVFKYLGDERKPFSLRDWIDKDDDSWLFLSSKADLHDAVKPILTLWIDIIIRSVMTLPPVRDQRIWLMLDELPSLGKVNSLDVALTQARKYGLCTVLGLQNIAQLEEIYGKEAAQVFTGMCQTWLVLRVSDGKTAKYLSDTFGDKEIQEKDESLSFGANSIRDGISLQSKRTKQTIIMPSEITSLPDLTGYLRLPGSYPTAKIKLDIVNREKPNPAYVAYKPESKEAIKPIEEPKPDLGDGVMALAGAIASIADADDTDDQDKAAKQDGTSDMINDLF